MLTLVLTVWDRTIHDYKLSDTAENEDADEYDQYVFTVRRRFDFRGKYEETIVDIKSKFLNEVLNEVMDGVKGVSLVEETPAVCAPSTDEIDKVYAHQCLLD